MNSPILHRWRGEGMAMCLGGGFGRMAGSV